MEEIKSGRKLSISPAAPTATDSIARRTCEHARLHIPIIIIAIGLSAIIWATKSLYVPATILWLSVLLAWVPVIWGSKPSRRRSDVTPARLKKAGQPLPFITILLPVMNEANMMSQLANAMACLDYPRDGMECLVLLEAHDTTTPLSAARRNWPDFCRLLTVPPGHPHTKARACNYALWRARSDILVVFDAEDQPHPMQLREAARRFARSPHNLACLQAPLEIMPQNNGWLAHQFALEYRLLFKFILPCLGRSSGALPLGGSSNYFRLSALRAIGGWDDHNLTEDADIGMRLAMHGYRIDMMSLPTHENAPHRYRIWHSQRTRWLSGDIQTLHVHMRDIGTFKKHPRLALSCAAILLGRLTAAPAHFDFFYISGTYFSSGLQGVGSFV